MSIEMMTLVWRHSRNKGGVLLMELAIADHSHDDGTGAFPSVARLTRYARQSERNVQYLLRKLVNSKEVSVQPNAGPRGTNIFTINVPLLKRAPDVIEGGAKIAPVQSFAPVKKVAPVKKLAPVKKIARGVQSSARGVQKRARGVQKRVKHRVQSVAPEPEPSLEPSDRTVKEPSSSRATRSPHSAEQVDRHWQMMMMNFGIEPLVAKEIAEMPHVTPEYLQTWIAYNNKDMERKMQAGRDKDILGPGFFVKHLKAGDLPMPMARAQRERERDAAHAEDKAYWDVKRARQFANRQRKRGEPIAEQQSRSRNARSSILQVAQNSH